jgi:uncharacterized protein (TIGR02145 family)
MKTGVCLLSIVALFLAACGSDSGTNSDTDEVAEVKTVYGLGDCKGANEGVTKLVTSENRYYICTNGEWSVSASPVDSAKSISNLGKCKRANAGEIKLVTSENRYYKCEDGEWVVTETPVQSSSSKDSQDKNDSTRKWPVYQDSLAVLEEDGVSPECAAEFEGTVMTYNGKAYRCYGNFWRPEKNPPKDTTTRVVCLKTTDPNAPLYCYLDSAIWNEYVYTPDASDLTKQAVVKIVNGSITGVAQKGPYLQGSTYRIIPLDGNTLKPIGDTLKDQFNNSLGTYTFCDLNLPSQYAMIEASGYYRSELTGNKSNLQMTIGAIVDVQKGANINIITNLEYERVKYLVQNMGYNIAGAKKRALTEVLWAFHIMDIKGSAEQLDITQGGDANGALLAISIMIQGVAGTEFNVVDMMKDFRDDLKEDGQWTGKTARTKIADIAYEADSEGKFPVYRQNVEGWKLSDTIPFYESYINDFWGSEYGIGKCTESRFGEIKKNQNAASVHKDNYFICDTVWYSTKFGNAGFKKGNEPKRYRWRNIGQFEYNTRNNVCNVAGLVIPGNIDKDKYYICHYNYVCSNSLYNQICVDRDISETICNNSCYYDHNSALKWQEATALEVDKYFTECTQDGKLHKFSNGYTYKCSNDEFVKATALDTALGKGCVSYLEGRVLEFDNAVYTYTCSSNEWSVNDVQSKKVNCAKEGSIQALLYDQSTQKKGFICDADTFRVATKADSADVTAVGAVCVGYLEGQTNKTGFFSCLNRRWIASPKTFTDSRDGETYKYIQIGSQKWMAENLNYDTTGSLCYNRAASNCAEYGRLYTWEVAKKVCPTGWHLPSEAEFETLFSAVGGVIEMLMSTSAQWGNDYKGLDKYGFSALPAGRRYSNGNFYNKGESAYFWSSTRDGEDAIGVWLPTLPLFSTEIIDGFSVRCVKD